MHTHFKEIDANLLSRMHKPVSRSLIFNIFLSAGGMSVNHVSLATWDFFAEMYLLGLQNQFQRRQKSKGYSSLESKEAIGYWWGEIDKFSDMYSSTILSQNEIVSCIWLCNDLN